MNILLGLGMLILGGISAGSSYVPFKGVKGWAWESGWAVQGVVAWLLLPLLLAGLTIPHLWEVLGAVPFSTLCYTYLFGFLWGIGGLAWGIAVRYIGLSLGFAIATGFLSSLGTIVPVIVEGKLGNMLGAASGRITLLSVAVSVIGIVVCGRAGMLRDKERQQTAAADGFRFRKGVLIAFIAGVLGACFAFGIQAGAPIREKAISMGASPLWAATPVFFVELLGGISINMLYCLVMHVRNRSFGDYVRVKETGNLPNNYFLCALVGALWYLQFVFYGMAAVFMGEYSFSNWSVHMSFMVVASNLWGVYFKEWSGVSARTYRTNIMGLAVLIAAGIIMGVASYYS